MMALRARSLGGFRRFVHSATLKIQGRFHVFGPRLRMALLAVTLHRFIVLIVVESHFTELRFERHFRRRLLGLRKSEHSKNEQEGKEESNDISYTHVQILYRLTAHLRGSETADTVPLGGTSNGYDLLSLISTVCSTLRFRIQRAAAG
jgi:hypothetical protein